MNEVSLPAALLALERQHVHYMQAAPPGMPPLKMLTGTRPVLFSAPHSTQHRRAGWWKHQEEYTGALVHLLHDITGAFGLYCTHLIDPDPHDDTSDNLYKQTLAELARQHPLRLVVDLHGVRPSRDFGVALGSMNGYSCPKYESAILQTFQHAGFSTAPDAPPLDRLVLNHPRYTGGLRRPTITRFAAEELGIPAIQVEINAWLRVIQRPLSDDDLESGQAMFHADIPGVVRLFNALSAIAALVDGEGK